MKRYFLIALLTAGIAGTAAAIDIEGVKLRPSVVVEGQTLSLNGAGLRTATVLNVRLYVASFYAPKPLRTPEEVYASNGPLRFDYVFLRAFPKEKVVNAWRWQFKQSGTHNYDAYAKEVEEFVQLFGPIGKMGLETVELVGDETRVYDDGVLRGSVKGKEFQKAFLVLWFGSKPVMTSLKAALLGKK